MLAHTTIRSGKKCLIIDEKKNNFDTWNATRVTGTRPKKTLMKNFGEEL